jgi:G6PDH family F420-dependent oxidoreductase
MVQFGYALSCEEHGPADLVQFAKQAEGSGFTFALITDHYHPWVDQQGQSPFVWTVIGAIAQETTTLRLGTGVTCPIVRIHPAIIAQAAATAAAMMPGRFFLGVGSGEALNEHVVAQRWPETSVRLRMLAEAIDVMKKLWDGRLQSHHGEYFEVENARIYTLPEEAPPVYVAASAEESLQVAKEKGDGLISVAPKAELVAGFRERDGSRPRVGQVTVCWAQSMEEALSTAQQWWPNGALQGNLGQELPLPSHFEAAVATVRPEDIAKRIACGPDPETHIQRAQEFVDAGFDHVYFHQVGPDQDGFFRFYTDKVLPNVA